MRAAISLEARINEYAHWSCKEKNAAAKSHGENCASSRALEIAPQRRLANPGSAAARPYRLARSRIQHPSWRSKRTCRESRYLRRQEKQCLRKRTQPGIHGLGFARARPAKSRAILLSSWRKQDARRCFAPNSFRHRACGERRGNQAGRTDRKSTRLN